MDLENKAVVSNDGIRYIVIDYVEHKGRIFAYLQNSDDETDTKFVELIGDEIDDIVPEYFEGVVMPLFVEKFKGYQKEE